MGRGWEGHTTSRENRERPQCHQTWCRESKNTNYHQQLRLSTDSFQLWFVRYFSVKILDLSLSVPLRCCFCIPVSPVPPPLPLCICSYIPPTLHFVLHLPSPVTLSVSSVLLPIVCCQGQAARPCPHTYSRGVQERLCSTAPKIQQGTKLLLLHRDTADLQCETKTPKNQTHHFIIFQNPSSAFS